MGASHFETHQFHGMVNGPQGEPFKSGEADDADGGVGLRGGAGLPERCEKLLVNTDWRRRSS